MAYCPDCGVYYTGEEEICPSCGNRVSRKWKTDTECISEIGVKVPSSKSLNNCPAENSPEGNTDSGNGKENSSQGFFDSPDQERNGTVNDKMKNPEQSKAEPVCCQNESQLGKGIIKPQKVEMAVDGVHFKYDTPSHSFRKEESLKERPKEYRVTGGLKSPDEICPENTFLEEQTLSQIKGHEKIEPAVDRQDPEAQPFLETKVEPGVKSEERIPAGWVEEEVPAVDEKAEVTKEPIIKELISEPVIPEPEIVGDFDNRMEEENVIWEGAQSWYKIAIGNRYRLTGRSLMIFDKYHYKLLDVSLSLITEVSVKQSWIGKLMGIGDLLISIPDFAASKVVLGGIGEPYKVKKIMEERIES